MVEPFLQVFLEETKSYDLMLELSIYLLNYLMHQFCFQTWQEGEGS